MNLRSFAVVGLSIFVLGCDWVDPFPEYRGVNLIAEQGLTVDGFSEAYTDGSDPLTTFDFVAIATPTPAEYGGTSGLPAGSQSTIRRLEVVNLVADGDFEAQPIVGPPNPAANWITAGSGGVAAPGAFDVVDSGDPAMGQWVSFSIAPSQGALYDLDNDLPAGTWAENAKYFFLMDFQRQSDTTVITVAYGSNARIAYAEPWLSPGPDDDSTPVVESFPEIENGSAARTTRFAAIAPTNNFFFVGSPTITASQVGFADNLRIGRIDNMPHLSLALEAAPTTGLPLVAGAYSFSVYVKAEIDAQVTPVTGNAFRPDQIVLGANDRFQRFTAGEIGWSQNQWVEVSATVELREDELGNTPALRLQLTVIDQQFPAVGRILFAAPSLTLGTE